jgi:hypothetical protein
VKQLKSTSNNVKVFNLHVHLQLKKLASYTTTPKEDLDANLMGTYRTIPCSTFCSKLRSMDKERRDNAWDMKEVLAKALVKFNDLPTNKE